MFGRLLTIGLVCFLGAAGLVFFAGAWLHPEADDMLPACPYPQRHDLSALPPEVVTATGAYEAIRETLMRDSLDGVKLQAGVIARAFVEQDQRIAAVAKRLAAEQDVESARRAFMRLHRLMERHAAKLPGG